MTKQGSYSWVIVSLSLIFLEGLDGIKKFSIPYQVVL